MVLSSTTTVPGYREPVCAWNAASGVAQIAGSSDLKRELSVFLEPPLELAHRNELASAASHEVQVRSDVLLPDVPGHAESGARLLDVERQTGHGGNRHFRSRAHARTSVMLPRRTGGWSRAQRALGAWPTSASWEFVSGLRIQAVFTRALLVPQIAADLRAACLRRI